MLWCRESRMAIQDREMVEKGEDTESAFTRMGL